MGTLSVSSATYSDMENNIDDVDITSKQLDSVQDQEETEYINAEFNDQLAIYKTIPEFKIALDMRAIWTIGNEIEADDTTTITLDNITGWGKGTFREILKNMLVVKRMCGDSFAEIVRNKDGILINLKPISPATIKQIYNRKGMIKRYEQIDRVGEKGKVINTFQPHEIFHLTNKRIADEIHGVADSEALDAIIKASNESLVDVRKVMHRYVKPMMKFILDTDDEAEINAFVAKADHAVNKGENLFIPKGSVEHELIAVPSNSTLNPLPWREHLKNYFYQVVGMPQIIMGSSGEFTESTAKIAYLAFEQSVKDEQTDIIEQVWDQLALRIKLKFPASLQNEMISDTNKDMEQGAAQPADVTAGVGR